jgi:luciferase family oxidoreductase group 1
LEIEQFPCRVKARALLLRKGASVSKDLPMLQLSVLDQSTALSGQPEDAAIRDTLDMARHCESLGYHRFWVSEHHNHDSIVGTAPEILIAAIAAATGRIRVGSAGIMLPNTSPLKVAEQFRVLEAIAPGRIDLGLGRAPGTDGRTARALNPNVAEDAELFPTHLRDLLAWIQDQPLPDNHPLRGIRAHPTGPGAPEVWILGSSAYGAQVAAWFGLPYCFAHFITEGQGAEQALEIYRRDYRPSPRHPQPHAAICVWALAAETEAEAHRLYASRALWRILRDRNDLRPLPTPEEAEAFTYSEPERARIAAMREAALIGTPDRVADRLRTLARRLRVDEIAVLTWAHDAQARQRSYALLAREFGLFTADTAGGML